MESAQRANEAHGVISDAVLREDRSIAKYSAPRSLAPSASNPGIGIASGVRRCLFRCRGSVIIPSNRAERAHVALAPNGDRLCAFLPTNHRAAIYQVADP